VFQCIAESDAIAFRELFDAYRQRLYAGALKITKSADAAEDIVQEIFTRIWENRLCLKEVENPSAYIFTIAYHESFHYLKKVAADQKLYEAIRKKMIAADNKTEEWLEVKETEDIIHHLINDLPTQRQLIYKLSREEGLSYKEIADRLHISSLTVKKQLQLALRNIRSGLSKIGPLLALCLLMLRH
jgi:RNA polymerase sigma-70 factor (ECF subfamily)